MKPIIKHSARILLLLLCLSLLSGCYDRRELDTMGIVLGVAIDKADAPGETEVTVQIANPGGGSGSKSKGKKAMEQEGEGGGDTSSSINVTNTGKNVNYIVREMQRKMSRMIYVAHSQVIVIGEELAKSGVRDALDFFARAPEARMTPDVFVALGKAKDVLTVKPEFEKVTSTELSKVLRDQKITSHAPIVTEFEFLSNMISKTTAAVAPLVSVLDDGVTNKLFISGCAVFKQSVMVGTMNESETRGLLYIKNKVKTGVMQLDVQNVPATVEIRHAKSKVKPVLYSDGKIFFNVDIDLMVGLGDQSDTTNLSAPENAGLVESASAEAVRKEIQSAVDKSKELNADVFGFGEYLNRKYPDQWKELQTKWDELYKNITVNINVKAKADGSGRIDKPLVPEGA